MAEDRLSHVTRVAVALSQMELHTAQEVLNRLNSSAWSEEFHVALLKLMNEKGPADLVHPPAPEGFKLHLSPRQYYDAGTSGANIREYLKKKKLFEQCLSVEDRTVEEWISVPSSYPESFRDKRIVLWKSCRTFAVECVATLGFSSSPYAQVYVEWTGIGKQMFHDFYTLLRTAEE